MKHKIINGKAPTSSKYIDELDEALYGLTGEQIIDLIDSVMPKIDACLGIPIITGTVGGVDKFDGSSFRWQELDELGQMKAINNAQSATPADKAVTENSKFKN